MKMTLKILEILWTFGLLIGITLVTIMVFGCASSGLYQMGERWCAEHPQASEYRCPAQVLAKARTYCQYGDHSDDPNCFSWDQAHLKANDHGCPTAVFVAPNGILEQCP